MDSATDLTTEARIRNAALDLFGRHGSDAVSVRAIAEQAHVSPPLVMHHFGSKAGLIDAVDEYVLERVSHYLEELGTKSDAGEAKSVLVAMVHERGLVDYVARALSGGGQAGARLFDRLYALSVDMLDAMIERGLCRPVEDRAGLATLLLANDLGLLMLRHHVERVLGLDPFSPGGMDRLAAVDLDLKTEPLITFPRNEAP